MKLSPQAAKIAGKVNTTQETNGKAASNGKPRKPADGQGDVKKSGELVPRIDGETVAYFDSSRGQYWAKNARGEWIQFTEASIRRFLKYTHFSSVTDKELQYAMMDKVFIELQQQNDVAYAGAIAGYRTGLHVICGQRVLVTSGPRLLKAREGNWTSLRTFVATLLGSERRIFFGWMKAALHSLYAGPPFRPGQMLAIAGPPGSGKSLLQNLITELLGGRSAKPYRYMTGETAFNSDLLQNEHLMIEDEAASTDLRIRRHFGSQLKNMIVNEVQSLHRKGRDALSVTPFWRVTITLNDEPENLMVLPPLDESLRDKLTLLKASPFVPPYAPDNIPARNAWRQSLSDQLPAFMFWLRSYRVPEKSVNVRYGVVAFQDEELLRELNELAPEARLLSLIDTLQIWGIERHPWEGTASELEDLLADKDKLGRAQKLLSYNTACGVYLARLSNRYPERITSIRRPGDRVKIWKITPPVRS